MVSYVRQGVTERKPATLNKAVQVLYYIMLTMIMRYAHLAPDCQKDAIRKLDTYLGTSSNGHALTL